jgi:hypothetical protein
MKTLATKNISKKVTVSVILACSRFSRLFYNIDASYFLDQTEHPEPLERRQLGINHSVGTYTYELVDMLYRSSAVQINLLC